MRSNLFVFFPCHAVLPHCVRHIPCCLTRGFAALRASHPSPLDAGISHAARAFSLPARRGDLPHCVRHIPLRSPRGFAALRASHPSPLAAGALGICRTACVTSLPARRGGPCKAVGNQGVARTGPLFRLCPRPYKSKLLTALGINGISIALRC